MFKVDKTVRPQFPLAIKQQVPRLNEPEVLGRRMPITPSEQQNEEIELKYGSDYQRGQQNSSDVDNHSSSDSSLSSTTNGRFIGGSSIRNDMVDKYRSYLGKVKEEARYTESQICGIVNEFSKMSLWYQYIYLSIMKMVFQNRSDLPVREVIHHFRGRGFEGLKTSREGYMQEKSDCEDHNTKILFLFKSIKSKKIGKTHKINWECIDIKLVEELD